MTLDLLFPARGEVVPTDHAYPLYAALSAAVPAVHDPTAGVRFAPLGGRPAGRGELRLTDRSVLRLRLPADHIGLALPLAGKRLDVAGRPVRLGPPTVVPLTPAATLVARLVTFKNATDRDVSVGADKFLTAVRTGLAALDVQGEPSVLRLPGGERVGQYRRRVVRVKGKAIVGYGLVVSGLSAEHSLKLQTAGLGGRTRIGCGFFQPARGG